MPRVLIVAYGNPLRSDDGIAWRAADALTGRFLADEVEVLRLHQLTPELADTVRSSEVVIFVDAACVDDAKGQVGQVRVLEVAAGGPANDASGRFSHVYTPDRVLDLASKLYGAEPRAYVVTASGQDFGHGDRLSPALAAALPDLVAAIESLVKAAISKAEITIDPR